MAKLEVAFQNPPDSEGRKWLFSCSRRRALEAVEKQVFLEYQHWRLGLSYRSSALGSASDNRRLEVTFLAVRAYRADLT
jgi:hypothetical protein